MHWGKNQAGNLRSNDLQVMKKNCALDRVIASTRKAGARDQSRQRKQPRQTRPDQAVSSVRFTLPGHSLNKAWTPCDVLSLEGLELASVFSSVAPFHRGWASCISEYPSNPSLRASLTIVGMIPRPSSARTVDRLQPRKQWSSSLKRPTVFRSAAVSSACFSFSRSRTVFNTFFYAFMFFRLQRVEA